ncbi:MAG: hypothetical protein A2X64_10870 [Ignavibacteria bacterium GWF2_33_9]|nr:MAG: hypothetical protein A2X64_10870 [Ignavibacteria bacterium GWF2_33_9]
MNSLVKISIVLFFVIINNGCNNHDNSKEDVYSTFTYLQNFSKHQVGNIYKQIKRTDCTIYQQIINYSNEFHFVHSFNKENHFAKTSYLEIRYLKDIPMANSEVIPLFFLISIDKYNEDLIYDNLETFSFVCCYVNRPNDIKENKYSLEISEKIDDTTVQLYTTLTSEQVKNLFPDFHGHYNKIDVHQVLIDYNYFVSDISFYKNVKILNFYKTFEELINLEQLRKTKIQ